MTAATTPETVELTDRDRAMLAGDRGEAAAVAMRILATMAGVYGAERLLDIEGAHIDGCLYHGDSGVDFAELLVAGGARVSVPTTPRPAFGQQVAWAESNAIVFANSVLGAARRLPTSAWRGRRLDLQRWSGRQKRELEFRGVAGSIDLPDGPGPLQPLFSAGRWLHLGKATTVGLGRLSVTPLTPDGPLSEAPGRPPSAGRGPPPSSMPRSRRRCG